jgi:maleylacetate reductase
MNQFHYTSFAQEVIFDAGALKQLREAVERHQWQRLMLCTTGSLVRGGEVDNIQTVLADRLVATYEPVMPHVPDHQVDEAMARALENEIDAVIGMGGGSPIGLAKAVSLGLEAKRGARPADAAVPTDQPRVPVIAIPTTYAGSEMTPVYGVTHYTDGTSRKVTVTDPKVTPRLTIYDPVLTLKLSPEMTASTGINALAHCVEAVYSITSNPLSTAAALGGARRIASALPSCYARGNDLEARTKMLTGSYLAGAALSNVAMGLHHGLCHVLGGTARVPHGVANAIMLPYVMRFNADATAPELAEIAEAMGLARNGTSDGALAEAAAQRVYDMVAEMKLPQHLREAGVNENDLPHLAELAAQSRTVKNNPKPVNAAQVESLLRIAW